MGSLFLQPCRTTLIALTICASLGFYSPMAQADDAQILRYMQLLEQMQKDNSSSTAENNSTDSTPTDNTGLPSTATDASSVQVQTMLLHGLELIGVRYRFGGSSPSTGLDCSGLVRYIFERSMNITLPHNAFAMAQMGQSINRGDLQPGDLVFFNTLRRSFSHVGIYLGDNKFLHAPRTGSRVQVTRLDNPYWQKHYQAARRVQAKPTNNATANRLN